MGHYRLKPLDDVVVNFRAFEGDRQIGEIRREDVHAEPMHLGDGRYWLVHEEAAHGTTLITRWLGLLRIDRDAPPGFSSGTV